jgi:benzoyl-CoA reductase/2-hydroxyglutaryl-CoA dehydratase subunit BcrC/BadD/HgdB
MCDAVGLTTTIPVEVLYAAGRRPVDLNNVFIAARDPAGMVEAAEHAGFPRNMCSWVKGIYSAAHACGVRSVIAVVQGDCSNTHALMEILESEGVEIIDFAYPYKRDAALLDDQINRLCSALGTTRAQAKRQKQRLDAVRALAHEIDRLCWQEGKATGQEVHLWTVACSDFNGDPEAFREGASRAIAEYSQRPAAANLLRLGYAGVPPVVSDLHSFVRSLGAEIVFSEMQRQFAMPRATDNLVEQYRRYTYPYDVFYRIADIVEQCRKRSVAGLIHYVQSFCFRQIQDRLIRERVGLPVLTLECDRPGPLDGAAKTRIETFVEMLRD